MESTKFKIISLDYQNPLSFSQDYYVRKYFNDILIGVIGCTTDRIFHQWDRQVINIKQYFKFYTIIGVAVGDLDQVLRLRMYSFAGEQIHSFLLL